MVGGKAAVEAGAVTHGAVRCSAWLGVSGWLGEGIGRHEDECDEEQEVDERNEDDEGIRRVQSNVAKTWKQDTAEKADKDEDEQNAGNDAERKTHDAAKAQGTARCRAAKLKQNTRDNSGDEKDDVAPEKWEARKATRKQKAGGIAHKWVFVCLNWKRREETPNDPTLSDGGAWRGSCEVGRSEGIRAREKGGSDETGPS